MLADLLRTLDDRLGFLRPRAVVGGQSANPTYYVEYFEVSDRNNVDLFVARILSGFCNWCM